MTPDPRWRNLYLVAAVGAILVTCMIPIQAAVFLLSPPPQTVLDFFALFQRNPVLGLLDLDLLLTVDYLAMLPLYLALYVLVRRHASSVAAIALVLGLFSVLLFLVSREATFSMWMLSAQHEAAGSDAERAALVASGQMLLTMYNGGTFGLSYVLGSASTLLFSGALWRSQVLGRAAGIVGVVTGLTMLVPPNTGPVGLVLSLLSLIPTAVWLVLVARGMLRVRKACGEPA